jgi:aspartyl-tRNA(Asn)/glutamyl-tRNA(Gln) amidotransferase subunit B
LNTVQKYEAVIGLEVHAQLKTASKAFCGCANRYGAEPNTLVCPICMGMPGVLPVLNRAMVEMGILAGLALDCRINPRCKFDRKNYFYPDLPKGYQISQYDEPLAEGGHLTISAEGIKREVSIVRVHLEEDAGKSFHSEDGAQLVDLNRCGAPLIEIVSGPDLRSPSECAGYLNELKTILQYLGICDANMEKGELRCDANISVREAGAKDFGVKTEVKNLYSFRGVVKALTFEMEQQIGILDGGGQIEQATLLWDEVRGETRLMRTKEESSDYRYFPEPDLIYLEISPEWLEDIRRRLPELPEKKKMRLVRDYGIREDVSAILCSEPALARYFEEAVASGAEPVQGANWINVEILRILKERNINIEQFPVKPEGMVSLLNKISSGLISVSIAKEVFAEMVDKGGSADEIIRAKGWEQISNEEELKSAVQKALNENEELVKRFVAGETKLFGALVGQVMKLTQGKANPQMVNQILRKALAEYKK